MNRMANQSSTINIIGGSPDGTRGYGDRVWAQYDPPPEMNMRTEVGRRRFQRFIDRLQQVHDDYDRRYAK